jgi:hypothetical protein
MDMDNRPPIVLTGSSLTHEDLDKCIKEMRDETDKKDEGLIVLNDVIRTDAWSGKELCNF